MTDKINPKHYKDHASGVECVDIAKHHCFLIGNVIKYIWRAGLKSPETELEDLEKARWYLNRKITELENAKPPIR